MKTLIEAANRFLGEDVDAEEMGRKAKSIGDNFVNMSDEEVLEQMNKPVMSFGGAMRRASYEAEATRRGLLKKDAVERDPNRKVPVGWEVDYKTQEKVNMETGERLPLTPKENMIAMMSRQW